MRRYITVIVVGALCALIVGALPSVVRADYKVNVGYADNLRPSPFFPSPWQGDPGTIFAGGGGSFDAGAIQVVNTGTTSITISDMTVDSFENGASFHIWGGFLPAVVPVGESMIFTQTGSYNFDSSDQPIHDLPASSAQPVVHVVVDSVSAFFTDTAQVLNTEGSDHLALTNQNESHIWREIGTFGGVPEPSSLVLLGLGGSALVARAWWRRRLAARS